MINQKTIATSFSSVSILWVCIAFALYAALSILGAAIWSSIWIAKHGHGMAYEHVSIAMAADTSTALWSAVIGVISCFFCAYVATVKATKRVRRFAYGTATAFACMLSLSGAISIVLHPDHVWFHQVAKLIAPFIVCYFAARLAQPKQ